MGIRNESRIQKKMKVLAIALTLLAVACIAQAQNTCDDCLDANGANGMAWCSDNGDEMCYNSFNECTGAGCFFCYTSSGRSASASSTSSSSCGWPRTPPSNLVAVVCRLALKAIPRSTVVIKR